MKRFPLDRIKGLDIIEVARKFGMNVVRKGRRSVALCPAHPDTSVGSMSFRTTMNSWHCFSCGGGGSNIDLVMAILDIDKGEAIREIASKFDIDEVEVEADEDERPQVRLNTEDYQFLGLKKYCNWQDPMTEEIEVYTMSDFIKDDREGYDNLIRSKLVGRALDIFAAYDQVLSDEETVKAIGLPVDELPILLQRALEQQLLKILQIAERGFLDQGNNPFPNTKWYKQKLQERRLQEKEPAEVLLSTRRAV